MNKLETPIGCHEINLSKEDGGSELSPPELEKCYELKK